MHAEIPVQVTAWVDKGVAPLVEALNRFPGVQTLDSCQRREDGFASVYFAHRAGDDELVRLISRLSAELGARVPSCCEIRFRMEWTAGTETALAELLVQPDLVDAAGAALTDASHHTTVSVDGTVDTEPRS